jgi:ankyrin repeat protein
MKSIDPGMADGRTPLIAASRQGHLKVAEVLFAAGANVPETDGEGRGALMWASCGDYSHVTRALLSKDASPYAEDHQGYAALILAKSTDVARLLLEARAEVNARAHSGDAALMYASYSEIDLVQALLDAGADADITNDDGETALTLAVDDKIRVLLKCRSLDVI